mmetsp:Transcript_33759/g.65207  ORF Transcript_33759/g.65207 Transcript_33759/m.65207 type:complete len:81 (-) Transcript_33759:2451-2693(-)
MKNLMMSICCNIFKVFRSPPKCNRSLNPSFSFRIVMLTQPEQMPCMLVELCKESHVYVGMLGSLSWYLAAQNFITVEDEG